MKKHYFLALCIATLLLCGCGTMSAPQPATYRNLDIPKREIIPQSDKAVIISDTIDSLQLVIEAQGSEDEFANLLREYVTDGLFKTKNVRIVLNSGAGDIRMTLNPQFEQLDSIENYYRTNCRVAVTLFQENGKRIFASKHFDFTSGKRVLGEDNAKKQYAPSAGAEIAAWAASVLDEIQHNQLNVSIIRFALNEPKGSSNTTETANRVNAIGNLIKQVDGVVSYQLIEQDFVQGICAYRIVYFRDNFPTGIVNVIATQL